jgi:hypothetical protein
MYQRLTKGSGRDRLDFAFFLTPIGFIMGAIAVFASLFARTMQKKGLDDPVYKKNVQRLIERNRKLEEAGP